MIFRGNRYLLVNAYVGLLGSLVTTMIMIKDKMLGLVSEFVNIVVAIPTFNFSMTMPSQYSEARIPLLDSMIHI